MTRTVRPLPATVGLLIASAAAAWLLVRSHGPLRSWRPSAHFFLRLGAAVLLLLLVADARIPFPSRAQPDWAVVVDGSLSMAQEDTAGRTRAARGIAVLPPRLARMPVLLMGATPRRHAGRILPEDLDAPTTDLSSMLAKAVRLAPSARRILLISDGHSVGEDPAGRARLLGVEVSAVAVGNAGEPVDVAVEGLVVPSIVIEGQPFPVYASIRRTGGSGVVEVPVFLEVEGRLAETRAVLSPDTTVEVDLRSEGCEVGSVTVRVRVPPSPGERVMGNNERRASLTVRRARWEVQLVADALAFDGAFLARSLRRDGGFAVRFLTPLAPTADQGALDRLPDALIVGQWRGRDLGLRDRAEAVVGRGGAVVLLGWPTAEWEGLSPLVTRWEAAEEHRLVASPWGATHPLTRLIGEGPLPPVRFPTGSVRRTADAQVIMTTEGGVPALAVRPHGRGQVFAWVGADWWRWILQARAATADPWPGIIRWLLSPEAGSRLRLHLDRDTYLAGEPLTVGVEVFDPGWEPAREGTVEVRVARGREVPSFSRRVLLGPDGQVAPLRVPGLPAGEWTVSARAALPRGEVLEAEASLRVEPVPVEQALMAPRHDVLVRLAHATGGIVVGEEDQARIDSLLRVGRRLEWGARSVRKVPLCFVALLALLGTEWWLRVRRGLP